MKFKLSALVLCLMTLTAISWKSANEQWLTEKNGIYSLMYSSSDKVNLPEYHAIIENGIKVSESFFGAPFLKTAFQCISTRTAIPSTVPGRRTGVCRSSSRNAGWWQVE